MMIPYSIQGSLLLFLLYLSISSSVDPPVAVPPVDPTLPRRYNVAGRTPQNPNVISIGAVLESQEAIAQLLQVIEEVTLEPSINVPGVTLYAVSIPLNQNPVRTAQAVCEKLIKSQVYVIILSDGTASESSSALAVTQTCNFYHIPVIGLQNRDSSFSDKHIYSTYMRTVPPYSHQVDVWIEMLKELDYRYVVFIHSADYDGRSAFSRFESLAEDPTNNIQIKAVIEYEPGLTNIIEELEEADEEIKVRVYLMYANEMDAQAIFVEISRLNMTAPGYVWIVSEQALHAPNVPDGILGLKLFNATNTGGHIRDAVYITGMAIKEMYFNENITRPPSTCGDMWNAKWDTGEKFFNYLRKQSLGFGRTGRVTFDGKGDRTDADYEIINVVHGRPVMAGQYAYAQSKARMQLWLNPTNIVWPGYLTIKPIGYVIPTHLKIATIEEEPFIFSRLPRVDGSCDYDQIPCPKFNPETRREQMFCCEGYCIDFLRSLSIRLNFSYSLYQVIDNKYGDFEHVNGTEYPKMWTGLVGDLVYKRADMVVAPLTINPERSLVIEFSKPFKYQGISILEKIKPRRTTFRFFNEPLSNSLWLLVGVTVHLVALALYLLDRFSPFGRYRLPNSEVTEEDALNLSSAVWFAWGVLLNSGIGEGTPRSFGGRVLGMVWAGFAMIMVASYTANLAAFLVLDRPETSLTGINDARLRNPSEDFTFATVAGSAVEMYFKRQIELANMYNRMKDRNYPDVEAGITAVKEGELDAFIWDSSRLEYEAAQDCDLATATEQFGRSGYGIGLPKNSFWTQRVNQEVLAMHESGFMEELDNKWILQGDDNDYDNCPTRAERQKPATLGLSNMAGVFILVGVGIVGGVGLIMIEVIYKKSQVKQQRQLDVARSAAERWKRLVEVRPKSTQTSRTSLSVSGLQASQTEVKMPTPSRPRGANGSGAGPSSGRTAGSAATQTGGNGNTIAKTTRMTISKGIEEV